MRTGKQKEAKEGKEIKEPKTKETRAREPRENRETKEAGQGRQPKNHNRQAGGEKPKVKIIPLGGLEQIGMNITAFEYEDSIIVVDCGLAFPTDDMLGIDLVIPDVSYLEGKIK